MFNYDTLSSYVKKLAKTNYWQTLYASSKEAPSYKLFKNDTNFTCLQIQFINELGYYSSLYMDIAMGEVSEIVVNNEIYEDAYYYYKLLNRKREIQNKKTPQQQAPTKHQSKGQESVVGKSEWVFTKVKG